MSSNVCVVDVSAELRSGGQIEVRAELSDGSFLQLNRTDEDLAQMMKRLVDSYLDDRETLSRNVLTGDVIQYSHLSLTLTLSVESLVLQ